MLSSVVGTYVGANGVVVDAVVAAISAFNIAAEKAAEGCDGPGSFKVALFDSLFKLRPEDLVSAKVSKA
jgi:hydroxyethylthiazole kinase